MKPLSLCLAACMTLLAILLPGCGEADQRLVTQVKVVGPRWVDLHERMAQNGHHLEVAEARFEKDFKEIEGQLPSIPDSLQDKEYKRSLKSYKRLLSQEDSLFGVFGEKNELLTTSITQFNEWEQQVMDGTVTGDEGMKKLEDYRALQEALSQEADAQHALLEKLFQQHNSIIRFLADLAQYHHNLDLKLE
jgi:hypothetical protein